MTIKVTLLLVSSWILAANISLSQTWRDLLNKADAFAQTGQLDSAVSMAGRGLQETHEVVSSKDTSVASSLLRLAKKFRAFEVFDLAEKCYEGCVTIRRDVLGPDHLEVAKGLNGLAVLRWQLGSYDEAEGLNREALAIREQHLGRDHLDVSESLTNLGLVLLDQRRYREGQDLLGQALVIEKAINGSSSLSVAQSEMNLGNAFYVQADYYHAEEHYRRALEARERILGPRHPDVAQLYDNLGNCYYDQGRFSEAEQLYKKALAIFQETSGGRRDLAISFQNLGILYTETRQYELAEQCLVQALELRRSVFGFDNAEVAVSYANLADLLALRKRYAEAESLYLRALPVCSEHERLAMTNALADLYTDIGQFATAESLYRYLETQWQQSSVVVHPQRGDFLGSYALYFRLRNNPSKAESYARSALRMWSQLFHTGASVMSERDALTYAAHIAGSTSQYLSCVYRGGGKFMAAKSLLDIVLSSKGVVSDLIFERRRERPDGGKTVTGQLERRLRKAQAALMRVYSGETDAVSPTEQKRMTDSLNRLCNTLESQIARRSAKFRRKKEYQNVNVARVAALLPANGTLVEYVRWEYADTKLDRFVDHYLVAVIAHGGQSFIRDLGEADNIDRAVQRYRKHMVDLSDRLDRSGLPLSDKDQEEYASLAKDLYQLLWQPIESNIPGKGPMFIAPDAGLNLISFAGLIDKNDRYLIEKYPLHYLSAGRDLVRLRHMDSPGTDLIAFGDPDYDAPVAKRVAIRNGIPRGTSVLAKDDAANIRSACGNLKDIKVGRLFHTRQEVESIAGYWEEEYWTESAVVYTDNWASEENFKKFSPGKKVIHLATHGYFIQGQCLPKTFGKGGSAPRIGENPLLLSGIFLAGSNLHGAGTEETQSEDGIVTALEVSSMDLRGVELVTLSACETALGEVKQGEGVYGLKRAFQLAGARTVVSALWRVPDNDTRALMKSFYAQKGLSYPVLMQKVALEHINDLRIVGRPTHPYTWGGFIATGDWRRK